MICINCGAKLLDDIGTGCCPKCGASQAGGSWVSGDTKVDWSGSKENLDKTMILPDFGEGTPVPDEPSPGPSHTQMKTNPQMDFSREDFEKFDYFDMDGSNPYGIEMPGRPVTTEKNAGVGGSPTVVLEASQQPLGRPKPSVSPNSSLSQEPQVRQRQPKEKYFPNGFLQEHPDMEPRRGKHKIGALDILILLLGLAALGMCVIIFKMSDGLSLISRFFGGDMNLILENMDDITYFANNLDVTWRLYYEIAAIAIVTMIAAVVFIILHCFVKNQAIGILKAGVGMTVLCGGYCGYYLITVGRGVAVAASSELVTIAGIGVGVAAVIWLIYMCIWGFTSFFTGFHPASMALLALGFVFAFLLMGFNLFATYKACHGVMPSDAMYEIMSTPAMITMFMVVSLLAALEDFLAKRVIDE